jgi:hypothetical protein
MPDEDVPVKKAVEKKEKAPAKKRAPKKKVNALDNAFHFIPLHHLYRMRMRSPVKISPRISTQLSPKRMRRLGTMNWQRSPRSVRLLRRMWRKKPRHPLRSGPQRKKR